MSRNKCNLSIDIEQGFLTAQCKLKSLKPLVAREIINPSPLVPLPEREGED